jgi:RNA-directed DNA polymerase
MAKGGSKSAVGVLEGQEVAGEYRRAVANAFVGGAEARVLGIQTKLHRWATDAPDRRFADLFNLVCDPAVLLVAWRRVRGNKGARTAGVDGQTVSYIQQRRGEESFLAEPR